MHSIAAPCLASPRILAETLETPSEPLALLVEPRVIVPPAAACQLAARALLDLPEAQPVAPPWLMPHQVRAFTRLVVIVRRFGGAVLADATGSGKSYVALAVAYAEGAPLVLVVPAVLAGQWGALLDRLSVPARIETHERLSRDRRSVRPFPHGSFVIVDEAHHFRNAETRRYGALARLVVNSRVLLVTATPLHNRPGDLLHLLRIFLRDDALVAFGVPSLSVATRTPRGIETAVQSAVARIVVARSRRLVSSDWAGMRFPERADARVIRTAPAEPGVLAELIDGVKRLRPPGAAALYRLTLLRRLASSVPALRQSLRRYEAFRTIAREASLEQRRLTPREFRRAFAMEDDADLQLAFLPLLLEAGNAAGDDDAEDLALVRTLLTLARAGFDPKAAALARTLGSVEGKTIVFVAAAATLQHLRRTLPRSLRTGVVCGNAGWLGGDRASRFDVLAAFVPRSLGVPPPPQRARVDVLLATDLVGEGLNLHDASRVIHYDLPWSPARLAQRVGRIDRLASPHPSIETVTFLPEDTLADAQDIEARLAAKVALQIGGGAAQVETPFGSVGRDAAFDWCDRLQRLAAGDTPAARSGASSSVVARRDAVVLVIAIGPDVEVIVVEGGVARADPDDATTLLEEAYDALVAPDEGAISQAMASAAPLLRSRLSAIAAARWRAADRDRPGRRLIPMVLTAARRAARSGRGDRLARLDGLVARLTGGLTAGEALLLDDLIAGRRPFDVTDLLAWHDGLPPVVASADAPTPRLVAAIRLMRGR